MITTYVALTTVDNPYNPLTDFDKWLNYDTVVLHYHTTELLGRIAKTSPFLSDLEYHLELENAIDRIIESPFLNPLKVYKKVSMSIEQVDEQIDE